MFNSKALKDFPDKKRSKLYMWWIETPVCDWYHDFTHKYITNPAYQVRRLWQWYWAVFKNDYDFDFNCMFSIIEYKLKRIQRCLDNGHSVQEPKDTKALKIAIKLAGRLKEDKYEERSYDRIDKKWGASKHWVEPCNDGSGNMRMKTSRPKVNTPEEKEQEWADIKASHESCYNRMKREEKWLYAIMHKYGRSWWD